MSTILLACYLYILMALLISQAWCGTTANHLLHYSVVRKSHGHLHAHHKNGRCSRCPPGWGVVERCSPSSDTRCEVCPFGTYSPHHSSVAACWVCSRCGPGLYEAHPCTRRADTLCDRCATVSGPHNGDFSQHCNNSQSIERPIEFATDMLVPLSSARRAVFPNLAAEPSASNTTERLTPMIPDNSEQLKIRDSRQSVDSSSPGTKSHVALGAAAIMTLQIMLLVTAGAASCFLARRLRSSMCLRQRADKERTAQEETLLQELQEMKPREIEEP